MKTLSTIFFVLSLALVGCSDDDNNSQADSGHQHADGGTNINEEGCEHLKQGPFVDVTAGADAKSATEVKGDHKAYRVALATGAAGYVKFAAGDKGHHIIFTDAAVTFAVQDDKGATVKLEKSEASVTECTEVKGKHTVDLPAVGTYYFVLGPTTGVSKVTLVIEEEGHTHP